MGGWDWCGSLSIFVQGLWEIFSLSLPAQKIQLFCVRPSGKLKKSNSNVPSLYSWHLSLLVLQMQGLTCQKLYLDWIRRSRFITEKFHGSVKKYVFSLFISVPSEYLYVLVPPKIMWAICFGDFFEESNLVQCRASDAVEFLLHENYLIGSMYCKPKFLK